MDFHGSGSIRRLEGRDLSKPIMNVRVGGGKKLGKFK